jgi:RHS repeat-associated protein
VLNELIGLQPGGPLLFAGTVSEPSNVTVQGKSAQVAADSRFQGAATIPSGSTNVEVVAVDPSGNTRTNTYQVSASGSSKTLTYDANGNLTGDGTRTFEWDAVNRLVAVVQGTHRSEFTYDGWARRVRIVEKDNSVVTSDRRFLWCGLSICEERDSSGSTVVRRFFAQGMQEGGSAFFYSRDHLGSIRELTDSAGAIRARYDYDPYGRVTKVSGDKDSVFGFTGHLQHGPSALVLAPFRAYEADFGRWISPDPIGLMGGGNLYAYVDGSPTDFTDPLGLMAAAPSLPPLIPPTLTLLAGGAAALGSGGLAVGLGLMALAIGGLYLLGSGSNTPPPDYSHLPAPPQPVPSPPPSPPAPASPAAPAPEPPAVPPQSGVGERRKWEPNCPPAPKVGGHHPPRECKKTQEIKHPEGGTTCGYVCADWPGLAGGFRCPNGTRCADRIWGIFDPEVDCLELPGFPPGPSSPPPAP